MPIGAIYGIIVPPIYCLIANFTCPEKITYGAVLVIVAAVLLASMTIEDNRTSMIDIRQLLIFVITILYLAHDKFSESIFIFILWLSVLQVFHAITILIDILLNRLRAKTNNMVYLGIIQGCSMPFFPPLTLAIWIYSMLLMTLANIVDLKTYTMFCDTINKISATYIFTLSNHSLSVFIVLLTSTIFIYMLTKYKTYSNTDVKKLKGFIAQADLLLMAAFITFFQQAHFTMIIFFLPFTTRLYRLYKKIGAKIYEAI